MKKILLLGSLLLAVSATSTAATLTFEGQNNTTYTSSIERDGFRIGNSSGQEQHFHEIDSTQYGLTSNGTGVLLNDRDTNIFVESAVGSVFSLTSVDVAASLSNYPASSIVIEGFLGGLSVGTISAIFSSNFITLSGASLGNLDKLVFDGIGLEGGFELDNLVLGPAVSAVPIPAAAFLFAPALLGFMGLRRKAKNTVA
ncbi:hypothetical protein LCGC14_0484370 [marine sediment metagenome]|uniref:PEP-CTERM protein-sorting domain-containing protein n=1 Tax=marine sediment metagenome TaxID=412755 RepID=A0A0F9SRT8_9ZZZZ|nr:hypothetical protein [Methylophaga sp.]HEC58152.1 hypothetical protein [Methylophaga sp.]